MTGLEELDEASIEEAIRLELEALDNLDLQHLESSDEIKYDRPEANLPDINEVDKYYDCRVAACTLFKIV